MPSSSLLVAPMRAAPAASSRDERLLRAIQYAASALDSDQPLRLTLHSAERTIFIRYRRASVYRACIGLLVVFSAILAPFTAVHGLDDLTADESRGATADRAKTA